MLSFGAYNGELVHQILLEITVFLGFLSTSILPLHTLTYFFWNILLITSVNLCLLWRSQNTLHSWSHFKFMTIMALRFTDLLLDLTVFRMKRLGEVFSSSSSKPQGSPISEAISFIPYLHKSLSHIWHNNSL